MTPPTNSRTQGFGSGLLWLVWLCVLGCGGAVDGHHSGGAGLAWALSKCPIVQVQLGQPDLQKDVWLEASEQRWRTELGLQVRVLRTGEKPAKGVSRVVIGCAGDPAVDLLLDHLQVERRDTHWVYGGLGANLNEAWLVATFRDPLGEGLPVTLLCAQDPSWLADGMKRLQPGTFPMLRLYSGGFPVLEAELTSSGQIRRNRWLDCRPWHTLPSGMVERRRHVHRGWRIDAVGEVRDVELDAYADAVDRTWTALGKWSGLERPSSPKLYGQDSAHRWRFSDEPEGWAQVDVHDHGVQVLLLPGHRADGGAQAGRAFLEEHLGPACLPWLAEAAAIQASGVYWGQDLEDWWAVLARLGEVPDPHTLISGEGLERVSPHWIAPLRALLVQVVVEHDAQQLRRLWSDGNQAAEWKPWFSALGERLGALAARTQPAPQAALRAPGLGVALQGGFDWDGPGLASIAHADRLQELKNARASAVAYTLHLAIEPLSPLVRTRPLRRFQGLADVRGETLLLASIRRAKELQLQVGLELELWAKPSGVVLQDLIWPNLRGVDEFFEGYGRGALHGALFAHLAGVDLLCLGEGMGEIARTEPREAERADSTRMGILALRSQSWKRLIQSTRLAFPGALTLSLGNYGFVAQSDVWSELDWVALDLSIGERDLAQVGGGAPAAQEQVWSKALDAATEACGGKPFVIWSVGLTSEVRPGQEPDLPGVGVEAAQAGRELEALGRALGAVQGPAPALAFLSPLGLDRSSAVLETHFEGALRALEAFAGRQ